MENNLQEGFYIAIVDNPDLEWPPLSGPFATLTEAALGMIDIAAKDEDGRRAATEVFYASEEQDFYVRWKGRWAFEEENGTVDPRAPLPDILKAKTNG